MCLSALHLHPASSSFSSLSFVEPPVLGDPAGGRYRRKRSKRNKGKSSKKENRTPASIKTHDKAHVWFVYFYAFPFSLSFYFAFRHLIVTRFFVVTLFL